MTGTAMIITGTIVMILATAGFAAVYYRLGREKRRIREEIYQIF